MGRFMNHKKLVVALALIATALILTHLPVSEADAAASASDFQIEGSTLTKYRGSDERVTIPDTVEVVGESAFENNQKVQFVVVPKSVKRLDAYVFWGCNHLEEVVLGKGLTAVDEYSFAGCTGLKQITIPDNVQSIDAQAFAGCTNLTDIYIPDTVTSIADDAFLNCDNVTIHADEGSVAAKFAQKLAEQKSQSPLVTAAPMATPAADGTSDSQATTEPAPTETGARKCDWQYLCRRKSCDGNDAARGRNSTTGLYRTGNRTRDQWGITGYYGGNGRWQNSGVEILS